MSALTPERLAEIRDRAAWTCRERGADIDALLAHVDHLAAENARLRKGVSRLHTNVERWHGSISRDRADSLIRETLRDLLDPTEGETDAQR